MKKLQILVLLALLIGALAVSPAFAEPDINGAQRVIVHFRPGAMGDVRNALVNANGEIHIEFAKYNAIAVTLPVQALEGISRNPNVTLVEPDATRHLMAQTIPYGIEMVQALDVWDANNDGIVDDGAPTGAGVNVCIIDSGIYETHEDFQGVSVQHLTSHYFDQYCGHGSHVAGTIAAANNTLGVVGVTPGAVNLQIVQVFDGADCAWQQSYASTLVKAADYCAAAGADIISMSLGGESSSTLEQNAFDGYYADGILSIAAAGNDWPTIQAPSYPASYESVVSVAAIDEAMTVASFSQRNEFVEIAAPGVNVLSTVPWIATNTVTVDGVDYQANHIEYAAYGSASGTLVDGGLCQAADTPEDWTGKVVLCSRGNVSFLEKVTKVQDQGGVAAVIYNNAPGNFLGTLGEEVTYPNIVAVSLSQEDGLYLVANKLGMVGTVFSEVEWTTGGYEAWGGTSMATPHVSGVAALLMSAYPEKTNVEIRDAMNATAYDLGVEGRDAEYGYGLVQAKDALDYLAGSGGDDTTPPVITSGPTGTVKGGKFTISWTTDEPATFVLAISGFKTFTDTTLDTEHTVSFRANRKSSYTYNITLTDEVGNTATYGPFQIP